MKHVLSAYTVFVNCLLSGICSAETDTVGSIDTVLN